MQPTQANTYYLFYLGEWCIMHGCYILHSTTLRPNYIPAVSVLRSLIPLFGFSVKSRYCLVALKTSQEPSGAWSIIHSSVDSLSYLFVDNFAQSSEQKAKLSSVVMWNDLSFEHATYLVSNFPQSSAYARLDSTIFVGPPLRWATN